MTTSCRSSTKAVSNARVQGKGERELSTEKEKLDVKKSVNLERSAVA